MIQFDKAAVEAFFKDVLNHRFCQKLKYHGLDGEGVDVELLALSVKALQRRGMSAAEIASLIGALIEFGEWCQARFAAGLAGVSVTDVLAKVNAKTKGDA